MQCSHWHRVVRYLGDVVSWAFVRQTKHVKFDDIHRRNDMRWTRIFDFCFVGIGICEAEDLVLAFGWEKVNLYKQGMFSCYEEYCKNEVSKYISKKSFWRTKKEPLFLSSLHCCRNYRQNDIKSTSFNTFLINSH